MEGYAAGTAPHDTPHARLCVDHLPVVRIAAMRTRAPKSELAGLELPDQRHEHLAAVPRSLQSLAR